MSDERITTGKEPNEDDMASECVMEALEGWLPMCIREEGPDVIDAVMRVGLDVMNIVAPTNIQQGKNELRTLTGLLLYAYRTHGTLDIEDVLYPEFVDFFATKVNTEKQNDNTRRSRRTTLRRIGRTVNPDDWQAQMKGMGSIAVSDAYTENEEASLKLAGELACQQGRTDKAFAMLGSLGCGLIGREIEAASGSDVVDLGNGRLGIWVAHKNTRLVPM